MDRKASTSVVVPVVLSVIVHVVIIVLALNTRMFGAVYGSIQSGRLPELQRLQENQNERVERFFRDTSTLREATAPDEIGAPPLSSLGASPTLSGLDDPLPRSVPSRTEILTVRESAERALQRAERKLSTPLFPPTARNGQPAPSKGGEFAGLEPSALRPQIPSTDLSCDSPVPVSSPPPVTIPAKVDRSQAPPTPGDAPINGLKEPRKIYPLDDDLDVNLEVFRDPLSGESFFRLTLKVRPTSKLGAFEKDNLFLVDVSDSVKDAELASVFSSLREIIPALPPGDRFNVDLFHLRDVQLFEDFRPFSVSNLDRLISFLKRPDRAVLTNLSSTVRKALNRFPPTEGRPMAVYLISDGMATAGVGSVADVTGNFSNTLRPGHSLFTFNAGRPYGEFMLDMMSYFGRGESADCPDIKDTVRELAAFASRLSRPVLVQPSATYFAPAVSDVYPSALKDLYRDSPMVVYGHCTWGVEFCLQLQGTDSLNRTRQFLLRTALPEPDENKREIAVEWARGRIFQLADEYFVKGRAEKVLQEIHSLSIRFGIEIPFDLSK
ncbi:MAG: hypothetical protein WC712_00310 [Candidatus Brocadiia bacterium]